MAVLGQTICVGLGSGLWLVHHHELRGNLAIFWQLQRRLGSVAESSGENEWSYIYSKVAKLR